MFNTKIYCTHVYFIRHWDQPILVILSRKEGRNWVLRRSQQLRSYRDEIETGNWEEIPYSSQIVPRGPLVAKGP